MINTICIYHSNCADGFGSAWVVRKALGEENIEFYPGVYQQDPPDVTNKKVIFVDFSYKRPVLLQMAKQANTILIIDHHKSAIEDLIDLPDNVRTVFDLNHSGAMLTWKYFFPNEEPPQLLKHIEDRDLWKFELPNTREIQANLFSYPYNFDVWDKLMEIPVENLITAGEAIERKHFKDIDELINVGQHRLIINKINVPACNLPYTMSSEAGNMMSKGEAFAVCYTYVKDGVILSIRSQPNTTDVSEVAKTFGGGGHFSASGCRISHDRISWENGVMLIK